MSKARTHAFKGKLYCEIPADIVKQLGLEAGDEVEFKSVHEKVAAVVPGKKAEKKQAATEADVLEKLSAMQHSERTRDEVERILSKEEKELFERMKKKKIFFDYTKKGKKMVGVEKKYYKAPKSNPGKPSFPAAAVIEKNEMIDKLQKDGCLVVENIGTLTGDLRKRGIERTVIGVRGFDKKFYIILQQKLLELEGKILNAAQKKRKLEDIAKELHISEPLCHAAIEVLREDGKIIESKRGEYVAA